MNQKIDTIEAATTLSVSWKVRLVALIVILVGLGFTIFPEILRDLLLSVLHREGSSHGLFVPFISGYFLWLKRDRIRGLEPAFAFAAGGVMALAGFLVLYISRGSAEVTFPALSFMLVAFGLLTALFGTQVFKEVSFPLLFLITMIPLPQPIYNHIAEWMREITTSGSVWITQLVQIPIFRDGLNIYFPNTSLFIAMGCSGIRYLLSYFVFSLAYAFLVKKDIKARVLVVTASFPIAIIAGVLRLSSIYLAVYFFGPFMAGRPHILISWLVFGALLVVAIGVDQVLSGIRSRGSGASEQQTAGSRQR
jgi:exosortase